MFCCQADPEVDGLLRFESLGRFGFLFRARKSKPFGRMVDGKCCYVSFKMSIYFRKKRVLPISKEALLFNTGSILDYIALYFLISTAISKAYNHQVPTLSEYGFISVTLMSWLFGLPYEWKLRWARYEGIVYVLAMAFILCVYVSIGISR